MVRKSAAFPAVGLYDVYSYYCQRAHRTVLFPDDDVFDPWVGILIHCTSAFAIWVSEGRQQTRQERPQGGIATVYPAGGLKCLEILRRVYMRTGRSLHLE